MKVVMSGQSNSPKAQESSSFEYPIHELLASRRSGRSFSAEPVHAVTLATLFEAARWAASSFNEQPWNFIFATKETPEDFARMLNCLLDFNIQWAKSAAVLILSIARLNFAGTEKPNRLALHDVGQATANLQIQATALGLFAHPMAGFDIEKTRNEFSIPRDHEPMSVIAVGYPGKPDDLPEKLRVRELTPRKRFLQNSFVSNRNLL